METLLPLVVCFADLFWAEVVFEAYQNVVPLFDLTETKGTYTTVYSRNDSAYEETSVTNEVSFLLQEDPAPT